MPPLNTLRYYLTLTEYRRSYNESPTDIDFDEIELANVRLDDQVVLAGLLRSLADRLDPPKETRY